ncbi:metal-dependent hydrolase [Methylothermus subterraneus]|nr:membrane-bound metal-dependent hydrolase [uncultured Gammaproteobacteria bacterium]BAL54525.1 membrane-bound metal-dependent hydrolase [uncultured Gammaproteobacteria bacterium]
MANFKTHLIGATLVSGAATTAALSVGLTPFSQTPFLFGLGVAGGLMPDLDADNSTPIRLAFTALGLIGAFGAVFYALGRGQFSIAELFLLGLGAFLAIRFGILELFLRLTEHRGVFHSLLAVLCFTLATASASYHLAGSNSTLAWLHGLLLGLGYLTHLILDELFSVDLKGRTLKRSFGTALKPIDFKNLKASLLMGLVTVGLAATLPEPALLAKPAHARHLYAAFKARLWPQGSWFAGLWPKVPSIDR